MSKRISILLTMVVLLVSLAIPVQAVSTYANTMSHSLSFTNTTANCGLTVVAEKANYSISATLKLYQGNTLIASWSASGTGMLVMNKTKNVTKGKSYTLIANVTIAGQQKPPLSITRTC